MATASSALHHLRHQAAKQQELVPLPPPPPQQGGCPPTTATGRASSGGNSSRKAGGSSGEQQPQGSAVAAAAKGTGPAAAASAAAAAAAFHCPICLDAAPEGRLCVTTCGHTFCIECIHDLVDRRLGASCTLHIPLTRPPHFQRTNLKFACVRLPCGSDYCVDIPTLSLRSLLLLQGPSPAPCAAPPSSAPT